MTCMLFITLGPFLTKPLEEAGFVCPKLQFALRNPMKIAEQAQNVIQEGADNFLYGGLKSKIEILNCDLESKSSNSISDLNPLSVAHHDMKLDRPNYSQTLSNIVDGQLVRIENIHESYQDALALTINEIPHGKSGLFFLDNREIRESKENIIETVESTFSSRQIPSIFTGTEPTRILKNWLCEPKRRSNDMVIIGTNHQCNGIESEIVIHIYPSNCPLCGISYADPVIISRATAMLIMATYQRLECKKCGWKQKKPENEYGWITPYLSDDEEEVRYPSESRDISSDPAMTDLSYKIQPLHLDDSRPNCYDRVRLDIFSLEILAQSKQV